MNGELRSGASGVTTARPPRPVGEIDELLGLLNGSFVGLDGEIARLRERISPIINPYPEEPKRDPEPLDSGSIMAIELRRLLRKLDGLQTSVRIMTDNLSL